MMRNTVCNVVAIVCSVLAASAWGGDAGNESPFSIGAGARALAMGGGFTALADDAAAVFYNPAGLPVLECQEVSFMHMNLFEGTIYNFAGWVYPDPKLGGFGLGYMRIGTDDIIRRSNYVETGKFDYSHSQFLVSYGRKLHGGLSLGVSLKIVNQSIDTFSDHGVGVDLGMIANLQRYVRAGIVIRDMIPPELELEKSTEVTPVCVLGGFSVTGLPVGETAELSGSFELEKTENRAAKVHTGAELLISERYALRGGYDRDNLCLGAGLKLGRLKLDYSYKVLDYIEDSHRFSLSFVIGSSICEQLRRSRLEEEQKGTVLLEDERRRQFEFYREKADGCYKRFRIDSALVYYNRALAFDEDNQEVIGTIAAIENALRAEQEQRERAREAELELRKPIENFLTQAQSFLAKKYYSAALDMLDLIFEIEPSHVEANSLRGHIEDAISEEAALELESAHRAESQGDYLRALEAYNRVLELVPDDTAVVSARQKVAANLDIAQQLNKGIEQYKSGRLDQAKTTFNSVLSVDRNNRVAVEYLNKIDVAEAGPSTLEDLQENSAIWQLYLEGLRHMRNREYEKAIEAWNQVLEVYPTSVNTLNNIEQARLRLKSEQSE